MNFYRRIPPTWGPTTPGPRGKNRKNITRKRAKLHVSISCNLHLRVPCMHIEH